MNLWLGCLIQMSLFDKPIHESIIFGAVLSAIQGNRGSTDYPVLDGFSAFSKRLTNFS